MGTATKPLWRGRALALIGILLVAANLRTAVAALSPIVAEIDVDLPLSAALLGVLGMLPPVCFAVFGIATPALARRFGLEWLLLAALAVMIVGHVGRAVAGSTSVLLVASAITFAALGVGNVLLPPFVKKYFPDRIGLVTTLYVTVLALSTLLPPLVAVPVADAASWRVSLGQWSLLAVVALVPWILLLVRHRPGKSAALPEEAEPTVLANVWTSPLAWALAVVFAVSALTAYSMFAWLPQLLIEAAGVSQAEAGVLLAIYAAMGIPTGLLVPILAARTRRVGALILLGVGFLLAGYLGLILVPESAALLWAVLTGLGALLFPLSLILINLRTRTHAGSVALSGFVQSVGYLIAAIGPLLMGILHDATGAWSVPLVMLCIAAVAAAIAGVVVARPRYLEDERARPRR